MFIFSALLTGLGMILLGVASMPQNDERMSLEDAKNWTGALPLISVILAAVGYQIGLSPITWSYLGNVISNIQKTKTITL